LDSSDEDDTQRQVAAQKAAAVASRPSPSLAPEPVSVPERQPTPMSSDTEDQSDMSVDQKRLLDGAKKRIAVPRCISAGNPIPPKDEGKPATRLRAVAGSSPPDTGTGKKASPRTADATQPTGAKAPRPTKGQESPETKVSKPVPKKKSAGRAGGLRPWGGSGQTDTCVAQGNASKT
jgi:hypothetical protein